MWTFSRRRDVAAWSLVAALVAGASGQVRAQGPAPPAQPDPVLEALVAEALANNPDVRTTESAVAAAQAAIPGARALPNPMLSMTFTNDGWAPSLGTMPMTTMGIMVSQGLPWPGKRGLRADLATVQVRMLEPAVERARLGIEAGVKRAYYGLLLARELEAIVTEQRRLWQQIEIATRARYAAGQGVQPDVLRIQAEVTRIDQQAIEQAAEADVRLAEINRLLARPLDTPVETPAKLRLAPITESFEEVADAARGRSPELQAARLAIEASEAAAALARRELRPDLTVQGGYMNRGGLDPMWQAGIGVSWPIDTRRRRSEIAEAEIAAKGGRHRSGSLELQLAYRTRERYTRAKAAERLVALYDGGIVPQDQMTVESALANYQTGNVPFASVLEAITALYADRWARAGLVAEHARLVASLYEASVDDASAMGPSGAPAAARIRTAASGSVAGGMSGGMSGR
ncbi:MAG TPA: TolC family protein [Vicinamibacterales bacterium]|mgnify:FL=1|nr:TolC family protein [Vicinamibacterales bacterium]